MLGIPLNGSTFKKSFLDGDGSFEISSDKDLWKSLYENGKPFSRDVQDLVDLKFGAGTTKPLRFGKKDALTLNVSIGGEVQGRIDLIWPDEDSELVRRYNLQPFLDAEHLYMAVQFNAKADVGAKGTLPTGPLSATFGIGAGGHVTYERLVRYRSSTPVKEILGDLFSGVRLPQQADAIAEIPAEGEVLATSHGGYLSLTSAVNWGYTLTGSRSFEVRELKLDLDYAMRVAAAATFAYRLAGDFTIETRRGHAADWLRVAVRKSRQSELNFAADFGFTATADLNGLPRSADDFLVALFGADARTALTYFAKAEQFSSLDALEKALGKMAHGYLQPLSQKIIGKALGNDTLQEFVGAMDRVIETYKAVDQRIVDLFAENLEKVPQLNAALDRILGMDSAEKLKDLADNAVWDLIRRLAGDRFHDMLVDNDEFQKLRAFARRVKHFLNDESTAGVRAVVGEVTASLRLDDLFKQLEKINTPEKLKKLTDVKLQGLVEKLLGKTFDKLDNFKEASKQVNQALKNVTAFKEKWYENVTQAVHQSFEFSIHYAFTRATTDEALLDVEVNLRHPEGPALAAAAASGHFADVLDRLDPSAVRINPGAVFTRELRKAAQLQINVFGWGYERLVELLQNVEHAIVAEQAGLIHVFTLETQIKRLVKATDRKKLIESIQSSFLLRAVGETLQPAGAPARDPATRRYVINTLTHMAVQYDMLYRDDRTTAAELAEYLDLAVFLGVLPDRAAFVDELNRQFPHGLGKVTVTYVVRYDDQAVGNAFTLSGDSLADWARRTARAVLGAKYTGMRSRDWLARIGFAYQSPAFAKLYYEGGFTAVLQNGKAVTLPRWFTGGAPQVVALDPTRRQEIVTLFATEAEFVKRLVALDALVDRSIQQREPIELDALQKASADFVGYADKLDDLGRENSFFAIFDKLVHEGSSGKWRRESAVVLEIEPPAGERVIKYLMA